MIPAAGVLILDKEGRGLFLKRGSGDHLGEWSLPGGKIERGENALSAAIRETDEEAGFKPDRDKLEFLTRRRGNGADFTTFLLRDTDSFVPVLSSEHRAYAWADLNDPPEPLHPGCRIAIARLGMDELGVARAIAAGDLVSPQKYQNVSLFAIRITGTGASYRDKLNEYVWRDPSIYLNDDFLARCNGLPVIWEHPNTATLDGKEFTDRIVGTILFAYIKGDEVWGIAKIYDESAAEMLEDEQLSTSPGVVIKRLEGDTLQLEDGSSFLIEGQPTLLDHIAICQLGVWDKGGPPTGVDGGQLPEPEPEPVPDYSERIDAMVARVADLAARIHKRLDELEGV